MPKFDVLVGCNYPPGDTRAEPGDVIDVPAKIGRALVDAGAAAPHKPLSGDEGDEPTLTTTTSGLTSHAGGEG